MPVRRSAGMRHRRVRAQAPTRRTAAPSTRSACRAIARSGAARRSASRMSARSMRSAPAEAARLGAARRFPPPRRARWTLSARGEAASSGAAHRSPLASEGEAPLLSVAHTPALVAAKHVCGAEVSSEQAIARSTRSGQESLMKTSSEGRPLWQPLMQVPGEDVGDLTGQRATSSTTPRT